MGNIATERLTLRKIKQSDYEEMKIILQDEKLMLVGWGKTYSDEEVQVWIDKIAERLGMKVIDDYMRDHNGKDVFHLIYALTKEEYKGRSH